jgi:hypothetical protein
LATADGLVTEDNKSIGLSFSLRYIAQDLREHLRARAGKRHERRREHMGASIGPLPTDSGNTDAASA